VRWCSGMGSVAAGPTEMSLSRKISSFQEYLDSTLGLPHITGFKVMLVGGRATGRMNSNYIAIDNSSFANVSSCCGQS